MLTCWSWLMRSATMLVAFRLRRCQTACEALVFCLTGLLCYSSKSTSSASSSAEFSWCSWAASILCASLEATSILLFHRLFRFRRGWVFCKSFLPLNLRDLSRFLLRFISRLRSNFGFPSGFRFLRVRFSRFFSAGAVSFLLLFLWFLGFLGFVILRRRFPGIAFIIIP